MTIRRIVYSRTFQKELRKLPKEILELAAARERVFRENPFHSSLRLHQLHGRLKGLWSLSIAGNCRIIFEREPNGDILFISIGNHDIYRGV